MAGRIQTTHVGSLPRTKQITDLVFAREAGVPVEEDGFNRIVGEAIVEIVAKQKAAGVSLPSDGELSKISYATYIKDRLTGFDGQRIYSPIALSAYVETHGGTPISFAVERNGQPLTLSVTPQTLPNERVPRIGIAWDTSGRMSIAHPNPIEQVYNSVTSTLDTIGAVASPKSDVKLQHLSGPVGIIRIYYLLFETDRGWQLALWFSVILNVNLAILNMLPIPVLDGGHIVLALVEAVRRKPVNMRVLEIIQTGCAVLIIGYIAYISFFDVGDLIGEKREASETPAARASPSP